jgi:hypothetical protein
LSTGGNTLEVVQVVEDYIYVQGGMKDSKRVVMKINRGPLTGVHIVCIIEQGHFQQVKAYMGRIISE